MTALDPTAIRALRSLYAEIPDVECKGLCITACRTRIDMSGLERERIERRIGRPLPLAMSRVEGLPCPMLDHSRCTIYGLRPVVCRLYGVVESMICPHGCLPPGGRHFTDDEALDFMVRAMEIGGSPHGDVRQARALLEHLPEAKPLFARVMRGDRAARDEVAALIQARFPDGVPLDE